MSFEHPYHQFERIPSGVFFKLQARSPQAWPAQDCPPTPSPFPHFQGSRAIECTGTVGQEPVLCLPLLDINVEVRVDYTIARTRLVQRFTNNSDLAVPEAHYTFPLYDGSAITSFRFYIGDSRVLEGQVKPKEEAKREYKRAIEKMEAAALLEEHTPEVFETIIGNIPPRTTVKVDITYVNELKADLGGEGVLVTIPTSIAPRYGQDPEGYSATSGVTEVGLSVVVEINAPDPIQKVDCRTHPISLEMGKLGLPTEAQSWDTLAKPLNSSDSFNPKQATARLSEPSTAMDKDFVLSITTSGDSLLRSRALLSPTNSLGHAALMVSLRPRDLFPNFIPCEPFTGEIVFLADRSGSMAGAKMTALRDVLRVFLKSFPETCHFNLFSFGSTFSSLWQNSKIYDQNNLDAAISHVSQFEGDMGGTSILPALKQLVDNRLPNGASMQVMILTDGEVWNTDETINFVAKKRSELGDEIRFFALGIGNEVSHRLIEGIGSWGGGFGEICGLDMRGEWQEKVMNLLNGALMPQTWSFEMNLGAGLRCENLAVDNFATLATGEPKSTSAIYIQAPHLIPPIHHYGRKSIFFLVKLGKRNAPKAITINATSKTNDTPLVTLEVMETVSDATAIQHLAAKAALSDLDSQVTSPAAASDAIVCQNAILIGGLYAVQSRWTSFVAIDQSTKDSNEINSYNAPFHDLTLLTSPTTRFGEFIPAPLGSKSHNWLAPEEVSSVEATSSTIEDSPRSRVEVACDRYSRHSMDQLNSDALSLPRIDHTKIDWFYIVEAQAVTGAFHLNDDIREKLSTHFCPNVRDAVFKIVRALSNNTFPAVRGQETLLDTLMVIQYVRTHLHQRKGLWDLMIRKAEAFIEKAIPNQSTTGRFAHMLESSISHTHFKILFPSSIDEFPVSCQVCGTTGGEDRVSEESRSEHHHQRTNRWDWMKRKAEKYIEKVMRSQRSTVKLANMADKTVRSSTLPQKDGVGSGHPFACGFEDCSRRFSSWDNLWSHQIYDSHVHCL